MKLNNRGFAISSIMYLILILAIILIAATLSILGSRKLIIDKTKDEVLNNIYSANEISYRDVLNVLKEEVIIYAKNNSIENDSILISSLDSSISDEILDSYNLSNKYLIIIKNNTSYNVYLGKSENITNISKPVNNLIDILDYKISGNSIQNGTPSPTTPVEIESLGDYDETTEKYVIPITLSGKNLMNTSSANIVGGTKTTIENGFKLVPTDKKGGETYSNSYGRFHSSNYSNKDLYLETGTYTLSYDVKIIEPSEAGSTTTSSFLFVSDSKTEIGSTMANLDINLSKEKVKYTFTLTSPKWVTYALRLNGMTVEITNMQLEKGETATDYESYVEPITHNIYLDEPLRCVESDCDYIDFSNQQIIRKINAKQITSSYAWTDNYFPTLLFIMGKQYYIKNGSSAKVMNKYSPSTYFTGTNGGGSGIGFVKSDTYWGFSTIDDMKSWLDEHTDMVAYYAFANQPDPQTIELPNLSVNNGHNNISIDTSIKPSSVEFTIIKKIKQI